MLRSDYSLFLSEQREVHHSKVMLLAGALQPSSGGHDPASSQQHLCVSPSPRGMDHG